MNNDLISRSDLIDTFSNTVFFDEDSKCKALELIDKAPTVEPFDPDYVGAERLKARQRGYEDGYHNGMKIGKTLNPKIKQGEWIIGYTAKRKKVSVCNLCNCISLQGKTNFCHNCGAKIGKEGAV